MMRRDATIMVSVEMRGGETMRAAIDIEGPYVEAFSPLDECDEDVLLPMLMGGNHVNTMAYRREMRKREGFAKDLAEKLTDHIVKLMSERDTKNGYAREPT